MKLITSWDDGCNLDINLAQMLREHDIPGIFFVPNKEVRGKRLTDSQIIDLSKKGFTIGGHTVNHPNDLKLLDEEAQIKEIRDNKIWLEGLIGKKLEWFCYPSGRYNDTTVEVLKGLGYKYARTVVVGETKEPLDPYRIKTSIHVYPNRKEYNGFNWLEVAKRKLREANNKEGLFHLWGHSWEVEKFGLWEELEELFRLMEKEYVYEKI